MLFTVIISLFFVGLSFLADITISNIVTTMESEFGANFINNLHIFMNAAPEVKESYCTNSIENFTQLAGVISMLNGLVIFSCIGYFTAVI